MSREHGDASREATAPRLVNAPHTGNPWIDHHASFRRADMLLAAQKLASRGSYPLLSDQKEIIRLAIVGHDVMSILGGGEIIEMGPVAQAVSRLEGSHRAQIEALGFKIRE